jgi:carbohydrate kinase (thermoresistant glucokinase family)
MGVSSSGKSVVGKAVADRLGVPYLDGDTYHPASNKEKMAAGHPLTDDDRWPWLAALAKALHDEANETGLVVGGCSALKRAYRDALVAEAGEPILFLFLHGPRELLEERIRARHHEFMPASLLDSQLATLEPPAADENAIRLDIAPPIETIAETAVATMRRDRLIAQKLNDH